MTDPATCFGAAAADYDRARPTYPAASVAWLVPDSATEVVDGGAGTGKLTDGLLRPGRTVVAVDPDPAMLAVLVARHPAVRALEGRAEALPLADGSTDALVYGQAWHWVEPGAASAEAARVLRPGGTLGLIWNIRDEDVSWVAELSRVMQRSLGERILEDGGPQVQAPFPTLEHHVERWELPLTVDGLVELASSRSHVITATPARRGEMLTAVRDIGQRVADEHGALAMPYATHAFRSVRP